MKAKSYETANVRKMAKKGTKIGQSQELPVDNSPSNQQYDKLGLALYITALTLALVTFVGGSYYCITQIIEGLQARPIQWMVCILMAVSNQREAMSVILFFYPNYFQCK